MNTVRSFSRRLFRKGQPGTLVEHFLTTALITFTVMTVLIVSWYPNVV